MERWTPHTRRGLVGLLSALLLFSSLAYAAPASATVDSLPIGGSTTLTENHYGEIVITANDVTLDCAGYSVVGPGSGIGIEARGRTGVTITNCVVHGFWLGIFYVESSTGTIVGNTAFDTHQGVALNTADHTLVSGNEVYANSTAGIGMYHADDGNVIAGNYAHDNPGDGIVVNQSDDNVITENTVTDNDGNGIVCLWTTGNTIRDNLAQDNRAHGFNLYASSDNLLTDNSASSNSASGFFLQESARNTISGNSAEDNIGGNGILLQRSTSNTLTENVARNNLYGFGMGWSSHDNELKENTARKNTWSGFGAFYGSANNLLEENTSCANGGNDVYVGVTSSFIFIDNKICGEIRDNNLIP